MKESESESESEDCEDGVDKILDLESVHQSISVRLVDEQGG